VSVAEREKKRRLNVFTKCAKIYTEGIIMVSSRIQPCGYRIIWGSFVFGRCREATAMDERVGYVE